LMQRNEVTILRPELLIDGTGNPPRKEAIVAVEGTKILFVGSEAKFEPPSGRDVQHVDLAGKTILPGLVDDHVHLALGTSGGYEAMMRDSDGIQLVTGIVNAGQALRAGITAVKDCGARNRISFDLRDAQTRGLILGPRILVSGRPLCITGGHFHFCNDNECDGPWEVRKRARQMLKEGVDFIKLMASGGGTKGTDNKRPSFEEEEIRAAVEEAEKFGKTVSAHCEAYDSVGRAARGGVHIIQHAGFIRPDGTRGFDEEAVRTMVKKGLYYDPTLQTGSLLMDMLREKKTRGESLSEKEKEQLANAEYKIKQKSENLVRMVKMVEVGITPLEAIVSATGRAAEAIRMNHIFGILAEGRQADIIAVNGDPTRNISVLRLPVMVMQAGKSI